MTTSGVAVSGSAGRSGRWLYGETSIRPSGSCSNAPSWPITRQTANAAQIAVAATLGSSPKTASAKPTSTSVGASWASVVSNRSPRAPVRSPEAAPYASPVLRPSTPSTSAVPRTVASACASSQRDRLTDVASTASVGPPSSSERSRTSACTVNPDTTTPSSPSMPAK